MGIHVGRDPQGPNVGTVETIGASCFTVDRFLSSNREDAARRASNIGFMLILSPEMESTRKITPYMSPLYIGGTWGRSPTLWQPTQPGAQLWRVKLGYRVNLLDNFFLHCLVLLRAGIPPVIR